MNKTKKRILQILVVLLILLIVFNWGRLGGAYRVYRVVDQLSTQIQEGNDSLTFRIDSDWGTGDSHKSLVAVIDYQKDGHFLADVLYDKNRIVINSNNLLTEIDLVKSGLRISAEGKEKTNFDLLLMLGEILKDHPTFEPATSLDFIDKSGIAAWAFFNCEFDEEDTYKIVRFPQESTGLDITFKIEDESWKDIRFIIVDENNPVRIQLRLDTFDFPESDDLIKTKTELMVNRGELNRAIYRGVLRAAGILLENARPPEVDTTEHRWGKGLLTFINGNRVLVAKGTNSEIGAAHGTLLKSEVRKMIDATLYTVGWAYTVERKRWFIDDMRDAYRRLEPFIPEKYQQEMAAMAEATEYPLEEIQLTNVFPALFHCSGFALYGDATVKGKLLHGRVLDYMTGIGLQHHAVVFALHPDGGHGFVNIGYAGFIGSVSGMNDQQVAFGEMGGRGEGDWDGMPMAFLMRDGLERANTMEEAVSIFRDTPRTCEYFYVISDGKIPDARGLSTTPTRFEIVMPDKFHEKLRHPIKDAVLMSVGDRYEKLAERVKSGFGKFDSQKAIRLMDRPVAMKSNLHNVLFAPQSLEFWVANAGSNTPAAAEPYTHYSLKALLSLVD